MFISFTGFFIRNIGNASSTQYSHFAFFGNAFCSFPTSVWSVPLWSVITKLIELFHGILTCFSTWTNSHFLMPSECNSRIPFFWETVATKLKPSVSVRIEVCFSCRDNKKNCSFVVFYNFKFKFNRVILCHLVVEDKIPCNIESIFLRQKPFSWYFRNL